MAAADTASASAWRAAGDVWPSMMSLLCRLSHCAARLRSSIDVSVGTRSSHTWASTGCFISKGTIRGAGALLFGDKCAGKTTTALFLAARGHGLLSDEVGAVHSGDNALAPFRRALSIRPGPIPDIVRGRLQSGDFSREILADGTSRIRARIGSLFHLNSAAATPLKCMFFLSGFAAMPRVRRITPGTEHLAHLQPFGSSMYGVSKRDAVFQLANMLARTQVYALTLGPPDATAALIEGIMEKT
jgi:hypothetical protein